MTLAKKITPPLSIFMTIAKWVSPPLRETTLNMLQLEPIKIIIHRKVDVSGCRTNLEGLAFLDITLAKVAT